VENLSAVPLTSSPASRKIMTEITISIKLTNGITLPSHYDTYHTFCKAY